MNIRKDILIVLQSIPFLIARELGWNEKELSNLKNAAHLHDIGKIAIPDTIFK